MSEEHSRRIKNRALITQFMHDCIDCNRFLFLWKILTIQHEILKVQSIEFLINGLLVHSILLSYSLNSKAVRKDKQTYLFLLPFWYHPSWILNTNPWMKILKIFFFLLIWKKFIVINCESKLQTQNNFTTFHGILSTT